MLRGISDDRDDDHADEEFGDPESREGRLKCPNEQFRLNGRQDRHDVIRIAGRHVILLANSLLFYRFALACKFCRNPTFSRCFIPSTYR